MTSSTLSDAPNDVHGPGAARPGHEIKHKTLFSVAWTFLRVGAGSVTSFVIFTILARELSPTDFGVFALALLIVEVARILTNAGLSDAIVRERNLDESFCNSAFWTVLGIGVATSAAIALIAAPYAQAMRNVQVMHVLHALAPLPIVSALSAVHTARSLRDFRHKALAVRTTVASVVSGVLAVWTARSGGGAYSLVAQAYAFEILNTLMVWHAFPWRPKLEYAGSKVRNALPFASSMLLTQFMWLSLARIQDLVVGRFLSTAAVGVYRVSWRMIDMVAQSSVHPIAQVSTVTFSHLQEHPERFRQAFIRFVGLSSLIALPIFTGVGAVALELVPALFGSKWQESARIVTVLSLLGLPLAISLFVSPAFVALGKAGVIARISVLQALTTLVFALVAVPFGLMAVAAAYVLRSVFNTLVQLRMLKREAGIGYLEVGRTVVAPCVGALAMAASIQAMKHFLQTDTAPPLLSSLLHLAAGGVVYVLTLLAVDRHRVRDHVATVRDVLRRRG